MDISLEVATAAADMSFIAENVVCSMVKRVVFVFRFSAEKAMSYIHF